MWDPHLRISSNPTAILYLALSWLDRESHAGPSDLIIQFQDGFSWNVIGWRIIFGSQWGPDKKTNYMEPCCMFNWSNWPLWQCVSYFIFLALLRWGNNKDLSWYLWKPTVIMMPTLSSMMAPWIVTNMPPVSTVCPTVACHNDGLRCHEWRQSWHHDNPRFPVKACAMDHWFGCSDNTHIVIQACMWRRYYDTTWQ